MKFDELVEVDIGDAVAVGNHKAVGVNVFGHSLEAAALLRFLPGVAQGHAPVLNGIGVGGDVAAFEINGKIRIADIVVVKILLDDLALVTKGQDEILEAKARVDGHDVPEHGPTADLDHGFGLDRGFFAQARTLAAAHDDDFHYKPPAAAFHGHIPFAACGPCVAEGRKEKKPRQGTCCGKVGTLHLPLCGVDCAQGVKTRTLCAREVFMKLFRRALLLPLVVLLGALVAACVTSGPQKALNDVADALSKNDGGAFLAQLDMKPFATNQIKNMTREDQALNALDSMGRLLGLGGMEDLLGSVVDMQARLQKQYMRGVSTGELVAQCAKADTPDCPWVPESLKSAKVVELGDGAAIAQVTTPARMTSWLALRKVGEKWLVVGQAVMESTAREYAVQKAPAAPAKPAPVTPTPRDVPEKTPVPGNHADKDGVSKI